jgi:hypothetical protein
MSSEALKIEIPKLPQLEEEDVKAVRSFLPGKLLGRTAALLSLVLLVLGFVVAINAGLLQFADPARAIPTWAYWVIGPGNVWQWLEDCWHDDYNGAPTNGSAWTTGAGDCDRRVVRGGSWFYPPQVLRSANRVRVTSGYRGYFLGFRVARTLSP